MKGLCRIIFIITALGFSSATIAFDHAPGSDNYILGFTQSLFSYSYKLPVDAVSVYNGYIYVDESRIAGTMTPAQLKTKLEQATSKVQGVRGVIVTKNHLTDGNYDKENPVSGLMPDRALFDSLIADPKWPRFTLAYQYNFKNDISRHNFAPNFGASIPIYRDVMQNKVEWEFGIQGGLFALMDIGSSPTALINADYYISAPITLKRGPWSGMARLYHLSAHLGDEFMLTPKGRAVQRINLNYEGIDLLLSYQSVESFRLYGGGGYIIRRDPNDLKRLKAQIGGEYRSPNTFVGGRLRPITGIDVKAEEMAHWNPGLSIKTGFQLENAALISNEIQLMLEYFSGKSIAGQFYNSKVRYLGLGLHAFL